MHENPGAGHGTSRRLRCVYKCLEVTEWRVGCQVNDVDGDEVDKKDEGEFFDGHEYLVFIVDSSRAMGLS